MEATDITPSDQSRRWPLCTMSECRKAALKIWSP
jgi:hypothetical protein